MSYKHISIAVLGLFLTIFPINLNYELEIAQANASEDSKFDDFFNSIEEGASELGKSFNEGLDTFIKDGREMLNDDRWDEMLDKSKEFFGLEEEKKENTVENSNDKTDPDQIPTKM